MDDVPEQDVAEVMMRGLASAVRSGGALSDTQTSMLSALGTYVIGCDVAPTELEPITPRQLADAFPEPPVRRRLVHGMVALEIVEDPLPPEVSAQVAAFAEALDVDEGMLAVAKDYSQGAMDVARDDFVRNSYPLEYYTHHGDDGTLHRSTGSTLGAPGTDSALAGKWQELESCPAGSHGRTVWDFYQARGFSVPGTPGAVDPLLAQHDWVHCLADYGTSALGEVEVFSFIASSIPDPAGFTYLVAILGLFETGYLAQVPGVATADPGHLSTPGGPTRFADALRRGLAMDLDVMGGVDWFEYADTPIDDVRTKLGVAPKSAEAVAAGSLSALDPRAVFNHDDKTV
jgi:hypothetical protein